MNEDLVYGELLKITAQLGGIQQTLIAQGSAFTSHCAEDDRDRQRVTNLERESDKQTGARRVLGYAVNFLIAVCAAAGAWFGAKHL